MVEPGFFPGEGNLLQNFDINEVSPSGSMWNKYLFSRAFLESPNFSWTE